MPRRRQYARPPIHERVAEVQVIPGPTSLQTVRDALGVRWVEFANVEKIGLGTLQFRLDFAENQLQTTQSADPRFRFWNESRRQLYQVGRELFVANDMEKEPGWERFGPMIRAGLDDFVEVAQPRQLLTARLRYLNRLDLPEGQNVAELFTIYPQLPASAAGNNRFQMIVEMPDEAPGPALLALAVAGSAPRQTLALDLVVESRGTFGGNLDVHAWFNAAHDRMTSLFETSITNRARQLFEER